MSFEDQFFAAATKEGPTARSHTAFKKIKLSTAELRRGGAHIAAIKGELHVSKLSLAQMQKVASAFSYGSANVDLDITEELSNFEPADGLIYKSKSPLWVLEKKSTDSVVIRRVWK